MPDVHTSHCCVRCGCKYGNPNCTVVTGKEKQEFERCQDCYHLSDEQINIQDLTNKVEELTFECNTLKAQLAANNASSVATHGELALVKSKLSCAEAKIGLLQDDLNKAEHELTAVGFVMNMGNQYEQDELARNVALLWKERDDLKASGACDACAGEAGHKDCMCGGTGLASDAVIYLRKQFVDNMIAIRNIMLDNNLDNDRRAAMTWDLVKKHLPDCLT